MAPAGGFTAAQARVIADQTGLTSEAHLMLLDPLPELDDWLAFCEVVVVHLESPTWGDALDRIAAAGVRGALAYSPGHSLEGDHPDGVDALVMSVEPGHGGSPFVPESLDRIATLASRHDRVGVDGGVTELRARDARAAGATWIVSGTALLADPHAFLSL